MVSMDSPHNRVTTATLRPHQANMAVLPNTKITANRNTTDNSSNNIQVATAHRPASVDRVSQTMVVGPQAATASKLAMEVQRKDTMADLATMIITNTISTVVDTQVVTRAATAETNSTRLPHSKAATDSSLQAAMEVTEVCLPQGGIELDMCSIGRATCNGRVGRFV